MGLPKSYVVLSSAALFFFMVSIITSSGQLAGTGGILLVLANMVNDITLARNGFEDKTGRK